MLCITAMPADKSDVCGKAACSMQKRRVPQHSRMGAHLQSAVHKARTGGRARERMRRSKHRHIHSLACLHALTCKDKFYCYDEHRHRETSVSRILPCTT